MPFITAHEYTRVRQKVSMQGQRETDTHTDPQLSETGGVKTDTEHDK